MPLSAGSDSHISGEASAAPLGTAKVHKGSSIYDIRWHGGRGGSAKSDFISKGSLIKHLMRGGGGSKKTKNHLISYMDDPLGDLFQNFSSGDFFPDLFLLLSMV